MVLSPTTLFTGQQFVWLSSCPSTNTEAAVLLRENRASEGCVVLTDDQTAGRGQRGNAWEAAPGENLTLSVIWRPTFLDASQQFLLSQTVALGVLDWAAALLQPTAALRLKWPNDLYFGAQKLGGILIENSLGGLKIQGSIVGIGLNVNQRHFDAPAATSLGALTGRYFDRATLAARLLERLEKRYLQLRAGQVGELRRAYLAALYRYQETHAYAVAGRQVRGQIVGVEADGRLAVEIEGRVQRFGLQEISYV